MPLFAVLALAFWPGEEGTILRLWQTVLPGYMLTTLQLVCGVGFGVLLFGTTTAWLVTVCDFPGCRLLNHLLMLPMAMPAYLIAIVYIELLDFAGPIQSTLRGWFGWSSVQEYWFPPITSLGGAVFLLSLVLYPYLFLMARTAFGEHAGRWLEVGQTLNLTPRQSFFRIVLPLARPAIVSGLLLAVMETVGDFGLVQLFSVNTFTVGIYNTWFGASNVPDAARLASGLLAVMLLLITLERISRGGRRYIQPVGSPLQRRRLGRYAGILACIWCCIPLFLGFLLPFSLQLYWCVDSFSAIDTDSFLSDATHSLVLGGGAAICALMVALVLAYGRRLVPSVVLKASIRIANTGYALPGPVLALGVLVPFAWFDRQLIAFTEKIWQTNPGYLLSGTVGIVIFAMVVRFLAMAFGNIEAGLGRISPRFDQAALLLKTGSLGILRRIHLPLLRSSMFTALLLVVVEVMKELPATLMLQPFNYSTLATRAFSYASEEMYKQASLWSVAIVAAGIIPIFIINAGLLRSLRHKP
ncbi:MAG: iron ABC transporter permease [Deltaproteobacteria bacterium]|nr:MAG: iron ABC transporter permease [Deltaproteobacteria bacterium]PIE72458.1 MAG: iron ABC transporter permease [Deltaproteobacteria bacterium]